MEGSTITTLEQLRKSANLTQRELAEIVGVSQVVVAAWEAGAYRPRTTRLRPLASALGVTVEDVLGGIETSRRDT